MATRRPDGGVNRRHTRPATTPEDRDLQLGSMAYDLAEKQFQDGTISAQIQLHFLKIVSLREKKEMQRMHDDHQLAMARIEKESAGDRQAELLERALAAFTEYRGVEVMEDPEDDYYE